jgi:hypothetical protein
VVVALFLTAPLTWLVLARGASGAIAFVGTLAALGVGILAIRRPQIGIAALIVAASFDRPLRLSDGLQPSISGLLLLVFLPALARVWIRSPAVPVWAKLSAGAIAVGAGLSVITAEIPQAALVGAMTWVGVLNLLLAVPALALAEKRFLPQLAVWISAAGVVVGLFGVAQRLGIYGIVGRPYAIGVFDSTFGYYSNFANFAALSLVVSVGLVAVARDRPRYAAIVGWVGIAVNGFSVVGSLSRGALIAAGVGIIIVLVKLGDRPLRLIGALLIAVSTGALLVSVLPRDSVMEFAERFITAQGGDALRQSLQLGGAALASDHPLGVGFGNFSTFVSQGTIVASQALAHSHNTFIQMTLDTGWLGGVGFLVLVGAAVVSGLTSRQYPIASVFAAALGGALVQLTQDFFFFETASLIFFALIVGGSIPPKSDRSEFPGARVALERSGSTK